MYFVWGKKEPSKSCAFGCRQCEREIEGMYTNLFLNECGRVLKDEKEEKPWDTKKYKKNKNDTKENAGGR